jgi:hypothetical protein
MGTGERHRSAVCVRPFFWGKKTFDGGKKREKKKKNGNRAQKVRDNFLRLTPKPGGLRTCVLCELYNRVCGKP